MTAASPRYRLASRTPALPAGFLPQHAHVFLGDDHQRNARRVGWVMALTTAMMVAEIVAGSWFGSMALLADGWHMATHAGAMLMTTLAYRYALRQANNPRFSFGTGKVGDLAGFASAMVLAGVALAMAWESSLRLLNPVAIEYSQAMAVAVLGLLVNLASAWFHAPVHSSCPRGARGGTMSGADIDSSMRSEDGSGREQIRIRWIASRFSAPHDQCRDAG